MTHHERSDSAEVVARLRTLDLDPHEMEQIVHFVLGYCPEAVDSGLDAIVRTRGDRPHIGKWQPLRNADRIVPGGFTESLGITS